MNPPEAFHDELVFDSPRPEEGSISSLSLTPSEQEKKRRKKKSSRRSSRHLTGGSDADDKSVTSYQSARSSRSAEDLMGTRRSSRQHSELASVSSSRSVNSRGHRHGSSMHGDDNRRRSSSRRSSSRRNSCRAGGDAPVPVMIKDYENYFNDLLGGAPVTSKGAVENGTSSQQNVLNGSARNNDAIDDFLDRTGPGSYAPAVGSAYASETTMNARLAYEDQNSPQFFATFMNNPEDFKARARTFFSHRRVQLAVIISLVVLCVLIVAISLGTKPDSGAANTAEIPNNTEDTQEQQQFLTDIKKLVSEKSRQELERSGSPQSQAINWLFTESDFLGYPQEKRVQRYVLATLYYATAGESWAKSEKWLSQADECTWYWSSQPESQVCDDNLNLLNLVLPGNTLVGTLPDEVSLLTTIKQIDLSQNSINSSLDASFGALTNIETLHLSTNQFQGQMPGEIGRLSSLVELLLDDNRFTGSLPSELGLLTSLTALHVDSNNGLLAETIPEEICSLTIDHGLSPQALVVDCDVVSCNCCSGSDGNWCAGTDQPVPETGSPAIPETAAPTNGGTPQPTTSEPCNEADVFDCRRKYMRG